MGGAYGFGTGFNGFKDLQDYFRTRANLRVRPI
jgi:hypothetical protein